MKHFIDSNGAVFGYEDTQLHLVTDGMRELSASEFDRFVNPQDYLTDAEKLELETNSLPALSAKDFRHMLDRAGLRDDIELLITQIEDPAIKRAIQNEYEYAQFFERTHPAVLYMIKLLELDDERVNAEWKTPIDFDLVLPTAPTEDAPLEEQPPEEEIPVNDPVEEQPPEKIPEVTE